MSGSQRPPQPVRSTTYRGVLIDIERVRDGAWHWRLDHGAWSSEGFFMQLDAMEAAKTAVDASQPPEAAKLVTAPRTPPERHWRSYGTEPLPTPQEALQQPMRAFPSWFLRITCDRCGKDSMLNEAHMGEHRRGMVLRVLISRMRHDGCGGRTATGLPDWRGCPAGQIPRHHCPSELGWLGIDSSALGACAHLGCVGLLYTLPRGGLNSGCNPLESLMA
jgi:hypothetical protein